MPTGFKRVSVARTQIDYVEGVHADTLRMWLLPYHGFYPSERIAQHVAVAMKVDPATIREVVMNFPSKLREGT